MNATTTRQLYAATFELITTQRDYQQTLLFSAKNEEQIFEYIRDKYLSDELELDMQEAVCLQYKDVTLTNPSYNSQSYTKLYYSKQPVVLTIKPYHIDTIIL